jgi:hypothetical protein
VVILSGFTDVVTWGSALSFLQSAEGTDLQIIGVARVSPGWKAVVIGPSVLSIACLLLLRH